jgi:uncharacterized protein (TIGR04255 family)
MEKIPSKINPCPVVEAVVDLRFELESTIPSSVLLGMLYSKFKNSYSTPKSLPINQIPEAIRKADPNLHFKPTEQIENDEFVIQLGEGVLVFINKTTHKPYTGKDNFLGELKNVIEWFNDNAPIKNYSRLGVRYIDFFDFNIFEESELKATLQGNPLTKIGLNMNIAEEGVFKKNIQVANNAEMTREGEKKKGSIIDIDTYQEFNVENQPTDILEEVSSAQTEGKELFFRVLGEKIIQTLNPKYE